MPGKLFLSHAHTDKQEAQTLRRALEDQGAAVWEDVLELRAGDRLGDLEREVKGARGFVLLWTPKAIESEWVEREAGWAREAREQDPDYRILVVLRGGGWVSARRLLGEELVAISCDGAVEDAVPEIRRALGDLAPSGRAEEAPAPAPLLEELVIAFTDARIETAGGRHRAAARFRVVHEPAKGAGSRSAWRDFESPLSPLELEEVRWYLERYPGWPFGTFRDRARALEAKLPAWGRELCRLTLGQAADQAAAWRRAVGHERRVVIEVDDPGPREGEGGADGAGAAALLALPWEILADGEGYLFEGALSARVVRRIPRQDSKPPLPTADRLRVLLVIARPEEEGVSFLDPRASARPLIEALEPLGHRAELEVLADGTFAALRETLTRSDEAGRPFHIVHFDGHGIYLKDVGLGMLCFEDPADAEENKLERRKELVDGERLGALLRERRVPLFVLEACQTAMADTTVTASIAARLLRAGVGSVLAMTHSVLVETARRFTGRFYQELARGRRIGTAMVAAEHHLRDDPTRGEVGGHGALELQDWFVPVLFQEEDGDRQLLEAGAMVDQEGLAAERRVREGELPPEPPHGFKGRARELLAVQRLLRDRRHLAILGDGGQGKTALAVECARWLLDLRFVERVAFASVEDLPDARLLLERLGRQLVPGYSVATAEGSGTAEGKLRRARLSVERVLGERRVLLVVDNLESLLPAPGQEAPPGLDEVLELLADFASLGATRLLVTSREAPPAPLNGSAMRLGPLSKLEGRELVAGVLARANLAPAGEAKVEWIDALVETVGGHARSLVLLAPLVAELGLQVTAESVARAMEELEARHPGKRELSLLASVRLSLDRLPEPARRQVRALAVFHGGVNYGVLAQVLEVEPDEVLALCRQLVALGLADAAGPYLFPDPALGPSVAEELSTEERLGMEERWLRATIGLIEFLYQTLFQDPKVAAAGTGAALKDLLVALAKGEAAVEAGALSADALMDAVTSLQQLVSLGRPSVRTRLEEMRRRLEPRLEEWSHTRFISAKSEIEQRLAQGEMAKAVQAAEWLVQRTEAAGDVYPDSAYDRGVARDMFAEALVITGRASEALVQLVEAENRLTELARNGSQNAARTLGVVAAHRGNALERLGQLNEAAQAYQNSIELAESNGDKRSAAVSRAQLGAVRLLQGRLEEALAAYSQALETFEDLREPQTIGIIWHQIGRVHQAARLWDRAEAAYLHALRICVELGDKSGRASTLDQMGVLYSLHGRLAEAAQLHQQAAVLREELGDTFSQARSLGNLAGALWKLGRLDDAREAADHAARLAAPFGHAAQPWKTWNILQQVENLAGKPAKAFAARSRAMELYAAYRRNGGEAESTAARLVAAVGRMLREQGAEEARRSIPGPEKFSESALPTRDALLAIVAGSRDPALAQDLRIRYDAAVELSLLLESLATISTFA